MNNVEVKRENDQFFIEIPILGVDSKGVITYLDSFYELKINDNLYYYLINAYFDIREKTSDKMIIRFSRYYSSNKTLEENFSYNEHVCTFNLEGLNSRTKTELISLDGLKILKNNISIEFKNDGESLILLTTGNQKDIEDLNLQSVFFNYLFLLKSEFIKIEGKSKYKKNNDFVSDEYYYPKFNYYSNNRYTRFSLTITKELIEKSFFTFVDKYNNNIFPLEMYILTQTSIPYSIQQRASVILNALEGLIKNSVNKEELKINLLSRTKRKIMKEALKDSVKYIESDRFNSFLEKEFEELEKKSKTDWTQNDIIHRIRSKLGEFNVLSLNEILEIPMYNTKNCSLFLKELNIFAELFWERCYKHRNFFAHLDGGKKGIFGGLESIFAMYIISNYTRIYLLECWLNIDNFENSLMLESKNINDWRENLKNKENINELLIS